MDKKSNEIYDKQYYAFYDAVEYSQSEKQWQNFFGMIANRIINQFSPNKVLDAGCAKGILVQAFLEKGIDAYGFDVSEYAISEVPDEYKYRFKVRSILEPFEDSYDVITNIEVIEHLSEYEGEIAVRNMCNSGKIIVFSSTSTVFEDTTHVNVRNQDYWVKLFLKNGFVRDLEEDVSYISSSAMVFKKNNTSLIDVIRKYDSEFNRLRQENKSMREYNYTLNRDMNDLLTEKSNATKTILYIDDGSGFSENKKIDANYQYKKGYAEFDMTSHDKVVQLRWDPVENEFSSIIFEKIIIKYSDIEETIDIDNIRTNGEVRKGLIEFYTTDPQVLFKTDLNKIEHIRIYYQYETLPLSKVFARLNQNILQYESTLLQLDTLKIELAQKEAIIGVLKKEESIDASLSLINTEVSNIYDSVNEFKSAIESVKLDNENLCKALEEETAYARKIYDDNVSTLQLKLDQEIEAHGLVKSEYSQLLSSFERSQEEFNAVKLVYEQNIQSITDEQKRTLSFIEEEYRAKNETIEIELRGKIDELKNSQRGLELTNNHVNNLNTQIENQENTITKLNELVDTYRYSTSWKLTKPLRLFGNIFRKSIKLRRRSDPGDEISVNLNSENIFQNLEAYSIKKDSLMVRGWVFSKTCDEISVAFPNVKDENISVNWNNREDVYRAFNCEYRSSMTSGYEIVIKNVRRLETLSVEFSSECSLEEKLIFSFNLQQIRKNNVVKKRKKFRAIVNIHNLNRIIEEIGEHGLKKMARKVHDKLVNYDRGGQLSDTEQFKRWQYLNENYDEKKVNTEIKAFEYQPKISILMPVYNVDIKWLKKCINSVLKQSYANFELCIADDCSTNEDIRKTLEHYKAMDSRIKVIYRKKNGHISRATNTAFELATGEFIGLLDNDDELVPHALYEVVKVLNKHPDTDMIYSDEDKIDEQGNRSEPHFKTDFAPDTLLSSNYICHFSVFRANIFKEIGGFRVGYEGSQDYDLILRFTEKAKSIRHIPKILYHWRMISGSTAKMSSEKNYTTVAGMAALKDTIKRRGYSANVEMAEGVPYYNVIFKPHKKDFVSIIIPTKDKAGLLKKCIDSIYEKSIFKNFEIIVVDNNSSEEETSKLFEFYRFKYDNFNVMRLEIPFNYSVLNNQAAKIAKGNLLLFLNNDVEVISPSWIGEMAGEARRKEIGAVGVKLLYPNDQIQHAGVVLGVGGVAGHVFANESRHAVGPFARLRVKYNYGAVTAACMMVRKDVFEEVGGFNEKLAVAFNDVDFCIKLINKGYYNVLIPQVELYHHESISRGEEDTPEKIERFNNEIFTIKNDWDHIILRDPFYNPNLSMKAFDFSINYEEPAQYIIE